jgi:hypothetical protein
LIFKIEIECPSVPELKLYNSEGLTNKKGKRKRKGKRKKP